MTKKKYKASVFEAAAAMLFIGGGCCWALDKATGALEPGTYCQRVTRSERLFSKMHKPRRARRGNYWLGEAYSSDNFHLRQQLLEEAALCLRARARAQGFSDD